MKKKLMFLGSVLLMLGAAATASDQSTKIDVSELSMTNSVVQLNENN